MITNLRTPMTWRMMSAGAVLLVAMAAGAQPPRFDRPLGDSASAQEAKGSEAQVRIHLRRIENGRDCEVVIENDQVGARVDGREVPASQIRRQGQRLDVLDDRGRVIASFELPRFETGRMPGLRLRWFDPGEDFDEMLEWPLFEPGPVQPPDAVERPRVMMGITMGEVGDLLREHLGLEPDTAVLIESVVEDLPAAKAGLRRGDIIVAVDGQRPVTPARIREILRGKEPGQKVEVVYLRRGQEHTATVELVPLDESRFGPALRPPGGQAPGAERLREAVREAQRRAEEMAERARREAPRMREQIRGLMDRGTDWIEWYIPPRAQDVERRLGDLDRRLGQLDRALDELAAHLDRLERRLEWLVERRERESPPEREVPRDREPPRDRP